VLGSNRSPDDESKKKNFGAVGKIVPDYAVQHLKRQ
jgi:hypothetical protein